MAHFSELTIALPGRVQLTLRRNGRKECFAHACRINTPAKLRSTGRYIQPMFYVASDGMPRIDADSIWIGRTSIALSPAALAKVQAWLAATQEQTETEVAP